MPGALPRTVRLVDGGVYNNLGTDWFKVLREQSGNPDLLWAFGELPVNPLRIRDDDVIIVNASAPSRRVKRLGPVTLARIMSVLYDNTVRPRVDLIRMKSQPIIDIAQSPIELAEHLARNLQGDEGVRAQNIERLLAGKTEDFWRDFRSETAGTKTKLSRAGPREAVRLMLHGYLSSLVLLHVRFGAPLPDTIRGEHYFMSLVRQTEDEKPAVGDARETAGRKAATKDSTTV